MIQLQDLVISCRRSINRISFYTQIRPEMAGILWDTGFIRLAHMDVSYCDWHLITALVERQRPETHTFHLPDEEYNITLQNITILTGLPIEGYSIIGRVRHTYEDLCQSLLGVAPPVEVIRGALIRSSQFRTHFSALSDHMDQMALHKHTRALILQFFFVFIIPYYKY